MANEFTARVAGISVELGMSVQNKSGIWCKPTVKMDLKIDGGTNPQQREAIIKQAFDEVCDNIEKTISEIKEINEEAKEGDLSSGFDGFEIETQEIYEKDEYIQLIAEKNSSLEEQATDLQLALADVYEQMLGLSAK